MSMTLRLMPADSRQGVKVAVVDAKKQYVERTQIFPHAPHHDWHNAMISLAKLAIKHDVTALQIVAGPLDVATDRLAGDLMAMYPDLALTKMIVEEPRQHQQQHHQKPAQKQYTPKPKAPVNSAMADALLKLREKS